VHGSSGDAVSVKSTDPEARSLTPGVYVAVNKLASSNVPSPEVDHKLALLFAIVPERVIVVFKQIF
jgi:hypothetical protein